jgi:hypothetical protein
MIEVNGRRAAYMHSISFFGFEAPIAPRLYVMVCG